jgi:hypothetical protein
MSEKLDKQIQQEEVNIDIFSLHYNEKQIKYPKPITMPNGEKAWFKCRIIKLNTHRRNKAQLLLKDKQKQATDEFYKLVATNIYEQSEIFRKLSFETNPETNEEVFNTLLYRKRIVAFVLPLIEDSTKGILHAVVRGQTPQHKLQSDESYAKDIEKEVLSRWEIEKEKLNAFTADQLVNYYISLQVVNVNSLIEMNYISKAWLVECVRTLTGDVYDDSTKIFHSLEDFDKLNDPDDTEENVIYNWLVKEYNKAFPVKSQDDIKKIANDPSFRPTISDSEGLQPPTLPEQP